MRRIVYASPWERIGVNHFWRSNLANKLPIGMIVESFYPDTRYQWIGEAHSASQEKIIRENETKEEAMNAVDRILISDEWDDEVRFVSEKEMLLR